MAIMALLLADDLTAQLNLKVGYAVGYTDLDQTQTIFDRFNANNPQAEQELSAVDFYHGIDLGLRYKIGDFGIEVGLNSNSGSSEAINVFQSDGSLGNDDWKISIANYYVALENYLGVFGYGASFGTQRLTYRTNFESTQGKKKIYEESVLSSKFYLILEVPSKLVSFSIRPYVSTTWKPYNIQDIELLFDPQSTRPASEFDQDVIMFGLSFVFYNGPQR